MTNIPVNKTPLTDELVERAREAQTDAVNFMSGLVVGDPFVILENIEADPHSARSIFGAAAADYILQCLAVKSQLSAAAVVVEEKELAEAAQDCSGLAQGV